MRIVGFSKVFVTAIAACALAGSAVAQQPNRVIDVGPPFKAELVADLAEPWAMTFLPDGRMLVTEKRGTLHAGSSPRLSWYSPLQPDQGAETQRCASTAQGGIGTAVRNWVGTNIIGHPAGRFPELRLYSLESLEGKISGRCRF